MTHQHLNPSQCPSCVLKQTGTRRRGLRIDLRECRTASFSKENWSNNFNVQQSSIQELDSHRGAAQRRRRKLLAGAVPCTTTVDSSSMVFPATTEPGKQIHLSTSSCVGANSAMLVVVNSHAVQGSVPPNLISSSKLVLFQTDALLLKSKRKGRHWQDYWFAIKLEEGQLDTTEEEARASSSQNFARILFPDTTYLFGPGSTTTSTLPKADKLAGLNVALQDFFGRNFKAELLARVSATLRDGLEGNVPAA